MPYRVLGASVPVGVPVGTILDYGGSAAPSGWLLCDGTVKKKADYAALFAVIGGNFSVGGEAGDEFRLPMCCGRTRIGKGVCDDGNGAEYNVGQKVGVEKASLAEGELPAHTHGQNVQSSVVTGVSDSTTEVASGGSGQTVVYDVSESSDSQGEDTGSTGAGDVLSKMQPSLAVTAIIKA